MSPLLQGEVALAINSRWLKSINFLIGAETELVVLVACSLQPAVFIPGELVTPGECRAATRPWRLLMGGLGRRPRRRCPHCPRRLSLTPRDSPRPSRPSRPLAGSLYVIHKGVALYGGRLLTSGRCWGQDMILARQHLCRFAARAMSYLEVYRISRAELLELARPFPIALRRIRWEALRLAMIRTMVATKRALASAAPAAESNGATAEALAAEALAAEALPEAHASRVWQVFMENASVTEDAANRRDGARDGATGRSRGWSGDAGGGGASGPAPGMDELASDPSAVIEVPSLHDLSRGLAEMRAEVAEVKRGVQQIVRAVAPPLPAVTDLRADERTVKDSFRLFA